MWIFASGLSINFARNGKTFSQLSLLFSEVMTTAAVRFFFLGFLKPIQDLLLKV